MTDKPAEKKPAGQSPAGTKGTPTVAIPANHGKVSTPESEAAGRIADLQARATQLQADLRTMQGRFLNRDPKVIQRLQQENTVLKGRIAALKKALFAVMTDSHKPRQREEAEIAYEALRRASIEYFKKANIAPEIWKNIES